MLVRSITRCILPVVKATSYSCSPHFERSNVPVVPTSILPPNNKSMPTSLLDPERLGELGCGTGQPAQRGRRKPLVWKRRKPWFDHQWSLDLQRVKKGPETPHFPDGVPFTQIRAFQSFAGRAWKINAGRRRKIRLSLKRGRRKLL
ncbi:hypothetical protein ABB37_01090 [Leptomonas pyrrhocoris]|uniref:Uncharacterized protein n=1 Tax=Leptomonas pyrrhocoris TaxID=157538 RepID=A0A0N0DYV4_LEPPY|nr:hypothetical protein ABB37_01090 [Leptomonas pyrrhocoris]KPA84555.1 hypothetical protein ABB37_01090 [Leptomonas pyrrhocoris]|eukprot:XP_015662994.1 hypothetical protein ABB37_01090 [Leptomonas pyrrhocoris]